MLFPTVQFAIFFCVVLTASWALMPHPRAWKPFILTASYVFYAAANWRFCALLAALTLANQVAARLIDRARDDPRRSKQILAAAIVIDLGVLGVFKYYGFFVEDIGDLLDTVGLGLPLPLLSLALPIGVSFFTFQAISYVVDVRRRLLQPASLLDFAIYLTFFPHLVAGPIVRAREFLPQLATPRDARHVAVGAAVTLIAVGLIKKVAIADYLAREVVDPVFAVPQAYSAPDVVLAAYAYAAQIYCDFSGYTDIAIGLALLMGFVFPQNFDRPYLAPSLRDFWRRWHMTLSRYLRDFLYIPLGGNRKGTRADVREPHDHDDARRPVARRGVDLRAVGSDARRGARRRARARGARLARSRSWCGGSSCCTSWSSAGSSSARPTSPRSGSSSRGWRTRARRRCGPLRSCSRCSRCSSCSRAARLAPARAQLGPAPPSRDARPGPRIGHPARRRDGPQPGRPAVHLLPVLR